MGVLVEDLEMMSVAEYLETPVLESYDMAKNHD
jgi:hypothetical protein